MLVFPLSPRIEDYNTELSQGARNYGLDSRIEREATSSLCT